jgi:anti-anti-sigma regulatory factor
MRFDLYQDLGRKNEFEERALDFVMKFERSSPAWSDAIAAAAQAGARTTASAQIALSGSLSAASKGAFEQLRKGSERQSKLRIDFSRLEGVDAEGCELLRATLKMLQRASKEVYISGETHMLALLKAGAVAGDSSIDQAIWLLLLDLYQNLDMHEQFEESAVDYAVTYEVSPPSWEARTRLQLAPAPRIEAAGRFEKSDDSFRLEGELAGTQDALFDEVEAYAAKANLPTFDFAAARRIDVANAGRLAGVAEKVVEAGKPIVMRSVGEMTIALFTVVGLHKLARIIPRK